MITDKNSDKDVLSKIMRFVGISALCLPLEILIFVVSGMIYTYSQIIKVFGYEYYAEVPLELSSFGIFFGFSITVYIANFIVVIVIKRFLKTDITLELMLALVIIGIQFFSFIAAPLKKGYIISLEHLLTDVEFIFIFTSLQFTIFTILSFLRILKKEWKRQITIASFVLAVPLSYLILSAIWPHLLNLALL